MSRRFGRFLRDAGGATAVEFALVAVPFLMLLVGGVEFGRMAWTRQALQQTAVIGARCMGILASGCASSGAYSLSNTQTYLTSVAAGYGVVLAPANMTLNRSATCAGLSGFSSVSLSYTFQTAVPGLVQALNAKTMTAQACFPNDV